MGTELAKKLRRQSTPAERSFWRLLYPLRTNGWHFRKQVQLGSYYVDFACLHAGVIVEIDGETHGVELARNNDAVRDEYLAGRGFSVLRFSNRDVMGNPEGVYAMLVAALERRTASRRVDPPPHPSPQGGGCLCELGVQPVHNHQPNTLPLAGRDGEGV